MILKIVKDLTIEAENVIEIAIKQAALDLPIAGKDKIEAGILNDDGKRVKTLMMDKEKKIWSLAVAAAAEDPSVFPLFKKSAISLRISNIKEKYPELLRLVNERNFLESFLSYEIEDSVREEYKDMEVYKEGSICKGWKIMVSKKHFSNIN